MHDVLNNTSKQGHLRGQTLEDQEHTRTNEHEGMFCYWVVVLRLDK